MWTWRQLCGFGFLLMAALGARANTCAPAAIRGTAPSDFQSYCWLDFSGYSDALAQGAGQPFNYSLPDGSTLSLTVQVSTNKTSPALAAHVVPSWTGSAIGHSGFDNIPGEPVLYETVSGSTVHITLSNISVTPPPGSGLSVSYAIIAADGESSNQSESLTFTTNAQPWTQVAVIPNGAVFPTVSGVGTNTVKLTGVAGTVGSYAFASVNNPTQITAVAVGGGLQGPMFAVRYASLAVSAQLSGARANASDQFTYSINSIGGQNFSSGSTTGAGAGPFTPATLPTVTAGYPLVVTETMAAGSTSTLGSYATSLTCTNLATGASSTAMPVAQAVSTYTFPTLQYGDAVSCVFTNTANRAAVGIALRNRVHVRQCGLLNAELRRGGLPNAGPVDAGGTSVKDAAVANFTATGVTCTAASGGGQCPSAGNLSVANLQGAGVVIPALPNGASVTLNVIGTAGNGTGNITKFGRRGRRLPPVVNSNANTRRQWYDDGGACGRPAATTRWRFPNSTNAGQPVTGTVTYSNVGLGTPANGAAFTLTLPAHLAAAPGLSGLPASVTYSYNAVTGLVTLSGMPATLAAGAALAPITVSYGQPPAGSSAVTAGFITTSVDANPNNNIASATVNGAQVADLSDKITLPAKVNAGQPVSGTVQYSNNGPSTASGVTYSLTLPANLATSPIISGLPGRYNVSLHREHRCGDLLRTAERLVLRRQCRPHYAHLRAALVGCTSPRVTASVRRQRPWTPTAPTTPFPCTSTGAAAQLIGTVYTDINQNAQYDAGDSPVAGATVQLLIGNKVVATTVTSAAGAYTFSREPPGAYTVAVTPTAGNLPDTPSPVSVSLGSALSTVNFGQIPASAVGALLLTKTTPLVNISSGQSVPYTITAANTQKYIPVYNATVTDLIPPGFRFRAGSGSVNGQKLDPAVSGRQLSWTHLHFAAGEKKTFSLVLTAGAGVLGGEFVNQAMAYNGLTQSLISNVASATVRITADPTFDCPDIIGKVFDDTNANGIEDPGERGIAGVRLVTAQGLLIATDAQGRYHIVCPMLPDDMLGSNFIVKLDERTLPSGYRLTTDNPDTVRLTAGKVSKLNFGATIHHVVRIELNAAAFEGAALSADTAKRVDALVATLQDHAYVLRLAYAAEAMNRMAAFTRDSAALAERAWQPTGRRMACAIRYASKRKSSKPRMWAALRPSHERAAFHCGLLLANSVRRSAQGRPADFAAKYRARQTGTNRPPTWRACGWSPPRTA